MAIADTVRTYLDSLGVDYDLVTHPHTSSSSETAASAGVRKDHMAKGVLLRDAEGYVLAVIPGNSWVRFHGLQAELNREFELAPEPEVESLFSDCDPGAVPCTGTAYGVETVVDEALASLAFVYFESGDHEHLARVSNEDFRKITSGMRHGHFSREE